MRPLYAHYIARSMPQGARVLGAHEGTGSEHASPLPKSPRLVSGCRSVRLHSRFLATCQVLALHTSALADFSLIPHVSCWDPSSESVGGGGCSRNALLGIQIYL